MKKRIGFGARFLTGVVLASTGFLWLPALPQVTLSDAKTGQVFIDTHDLGGWITDALEERRDSKPTCSIAMGEAMAMLDEAAQATGSAPENTCGG
ncbi:hypothetical protein [Paramicrobacterium agarici]|uniref:hypothetical protein n=1 Tax=Paramicrobacterium agarici TaxID=630514 RepID=UPI001151CEEC|nr:hypothetical protein [Microbacterium agarici]TQO24281.1 hypothetical protein FB385_3161 [Microbacterium agarici]